jgi:O-antigen/teichoic acid export membrane protein
MQKKLALRQFAGFAVNSVLAKFLISFLSVLTSIYLARSLGPGGRGEYALLLLITTLSASFGRMGITHSVNYFLGKEIPERVIANSTFLMVIIALLLPFVVYPIITTTQSIFFNGIDDRLILVMLCSIPLLMIQDHMIGLLQGLYRINLRNALLVLQAFLNLLFLFILISVYKFQMFGAVAAWILSMMIVFALASIYIIKSIDINILSIEGPFVKQLLSFGLKSHVGNILKDLSYRGDFLLINYFLTPVAVGYYSVAVNIAETIWKIPDAIGSVLLPKVSRMGIDDSMALIQLVARFVFIPIMIICCLILLLDESIISFAFGNEYLPSSPVLSLLIPGVLFFTLWKVIANSLIALGYPLKYSITSFVSLVAMLVFDIILIPIMGVKGAAIASSISYVSATLLIARIFGKITSGRFRDLILPQRGDIVLFRKIVNEFIPARLKKKKIETDI